MKLTKKEKTMILMFIIMVVTNIIHYVACELLNYGMMEYLIIFVVWMAVWFAVIILMDRRHMFPHKRKQVSEKEADPEPKEP